MWNYNFYVYITTNPDRSVLYIGVTNDLARRLAEHRDQKGNSKSFTGKYYCYSLVYYEHYADITQAIHREKQIKKFRREKKDALITKLNPEWRFLNDDINSD
jgi:putative endonuclease